MSRISPLSPHPPRSHSSPFFDLMMSDRPFSEIFGYGSPPGTPGSSTRSPSASPIKSPSRSSTPSNLSLDHPLRSPSLGKWWNNLKIFIKKKKKKKNYTKQPPTVLQVMQYLDINFIIEKFSPYRLKSPNVEVRYTTIDLRLPKRRGYVLWYYQWANKFLLRRTGGCRRTSFAGECSNCEIHEEDIYRGNGRSK